MRVTSQRDSRAISERSGWSAGGPQDGIARLPSARSAMSMASRHCSRSGLKSRMNTSGPARRPGGFQSVLATSTCRS
eukprot:1142777-Alexandrium_andersonii.AAC.1